MSYRDLLTQHKGNLIKGSLTCDMKGISDLKDCSESSFLFIKEKKFFQRFKTLVEEGHDFSTNIVLVSCDIVQTFVSECDQVKMMAVVAFENIDDLICDLSHFYYLRYQKSINNIVDARQLGTADIHPSAWISPSVFIGSGVRIAQGVVIHPGCVIMSDSIIGEYTEIFPNVTLYPQTVIGKKCRVHSGVVLGSDGYGYNQIKGQHKKIWHLGRVVLEDDVEIGANSAVDKGTFGSTIIGTGTKIDNLVHIAHNNQIGAYNLICGQVGFGGSATTGPGCVFGGKAGIAPDIVVGGLSQIAGNAQVTGSCPQKSVLAGHPARPLKEWLKSMAYLRKYALKKEN